jgi:FkbM family methyltransferase
MLSPMRSLVAWSIRLVPWRLRTVIKRMPIVAGLQRRVLAKLLTGREFVHTIDAGPAKGLVFPIVLPDDKRVWTGTYEHEFVQSLAKAVRPGDVCFDVGGWRGFCAGVMAQAGAARVVVFEPLPANCERIRRMIELNPSRPGLLLEPSAVGEQNGTASFQLMSETSMGKLENSPFQTQDVGGQQISVNVVSLDAYCAAAGIDRVDVIKLDVEGAELAALHGAVRLLTNSRPRLFIEAHSRSLAAGVTEFLTNRDYEVSVLTTGRPPDGITEPEVCHLNAIPRKAVR